MRTIKLVVAVLLATQASTFAATVAPTVEEVLTYTAEKQFAYLATPSPGLTEYYKNNGGEFSRLLVEIAAQDNDASEIAMYLFNNHVLSFAQYPNHPDFNALKQSGFINKKLSQFITQPNFDMKIRRGAILAHANLYPPSKQLIDFYVSEIGNSEPDDRGLTENILRAFSQYQSDIGFRIPESVERKLPELVHYRSEGIQSQAISMLTDIKGHAFQGDLFRMLESNDFGLGPSSTIVYSILSLDATQSTVDRLRNSKSKIRRTRVHKIIDNAIRPKNLERLKKNLN